MEIPGITVEVTHKSVKNMRLILTPSAGGMKARLSAPLHMPESKARAFVMSKTDWIKDHRKKFEARTHLPGIKSEDRPHFKKLLKLRLPEIITKWEKQTGLKTSAFGVRLMKSRWGSCNTRTKKIWLNLELARCPEECLDYVVLHEILHIRERGHGRDFKALLDKYMPEWKKVRVRLKQICLWHED